MSMLNESDWQFGPIDYDPCDGHDHCVMCGVCGDENELVQEKWCAPGGCFTKTETECLVCRRRGFNEDCGAA